jgi:hypothetical protein
MSNKLKEAFNLLQENNKEAAEQAIHEWLINESKAILSKVDEDYHKWDDEDSEDSEETLTETDDSCDEEDELEESYSPSVVKVKSNAMETGTGSKVQTNNKSPIPQKSHDRRVSQGGVKTTQDSHSGYKQEKAPKVKDSPISTKKIGNEFKKPKTIKTPY